MPLKKIGRAIKKVVRKVVPKEIAGIMQVAAPFVAAGPAGIPGALALSLGGQLRQGRGRISPLKTLLAIAPSQRFRDFTGVFAKNPNKLQSLGRGFDDFLYGAGPGKQGLISFGGEELTPSGILKSKLLSTMKTVDGVTKPVLSITKVGTAVASGLSLAQTQQQIEEEGEEVGLEPSEIARLQEEAAEMWEDFDTTQFKPNVAQGGLMRTNYALGSRPTEQESGLGGLPIEADMRYSGGFMPYGAKEKADDVPARLSKNEFVFTADAVRGAGGGDINTGAKKMYQSMKQLEQMGKRA
jgi:hypothetical protein